MFEALLLFAAFFSIALVGTALVIAHDLIAAHGPRLLAVLRSPRRKRTPGRELPRVRTLGHA